MQSLLELQRWLYGGAVQTLKDMSVADAPTIVSLVLSAALFGLVHALMPGHGKAVLTAQYAGHGRYLGALVSSVLVILTHVGSAIVLVLTGFAILQRTIAGAGRAPALERTSQVVIVIVGLWLLWRAVRPHSHDAGRAGPLLALAAGMTPCPLTTFVMTYAALHDRILSGLILSGAFAAGMIVTVAAFPLAAIVLRERMIGWTDRATTLAARTRFSLELIAALAVISLGLYPLLLR
jgi:nickel/cobalt transporter (NicO) family protein